MENHQQLIEIGIGFENYVYNNNETFLTKPHDIGQFRIENLTLPQESQQQDKIIKLATGNQYVLYLTESGKVYGRGWNCYNQLGFSMSDLMESKIDYKNLSFIKANYLDNYFVTDIVCGFNFSYFKTIPLNTYNTTNKQTSQSLYSIGWNHGNCCGQPNKDQSSFVNTLGLVQQYKDNNKQVVIPFEFTNDIELIDGGGSFLVLLVKRGSLDQQQCFVVGNRTGIATVTNCRYLTEHTEVNKILKNEKVIYLTTYTDSTVILTDIGNVYLTGRNMFYNGGAVTDFVKITNFDKIERKSVKQIFYLDSASLILTTDNIVFIVTIQGEPYKLEFSTGIKLVYGKGRMAFVITNDHRVYLIYAERISCDNNSFIVPPRKEDIVKVQQYSTAIGKFELNLSSVIKNYDHFMNYPFDYELKMSGCSPTSYLLIEKKNNTFFINKLFSQLQQNYQEEDRNSFFDIDFY